MRMSNFESEALIQSRWSWWATRTATGLVIPCCKSRRIGSRGGRRMSGGINFSKTELCGDDQWDGRVLRDVLDC